MCHSLRDGQIFYCKFRFTASPPPTLFCPQSASAMIISPLHSTQLPLPLHHSYHQVAFTYSFLAPQHYPCHHNITPVTTTSLWFLLFSFVTYRWTLHQKAFTNYHTSSSEHTTLRLITITTIFTNFDISTLAHQQLTSPAFASSCAK